MVDPKNHSVLVCGCARDVEKYLPGVLKNFARIGALFKDARYAVCENDSKDKTLDVLRSWKRDDTANRSVISLTGLDKRFKTRTERLPECRNALLDALWEKSADFMIMMDMDGICEEPIPEESILSCFKYPLDGWAAMTANISSKYYDIWALRSEWCPYDCWKMVWNRPPDMTSDQAVEKFIHAHKKHIPRDLQQIEVESAFGGLGVYQTRFLKGCRYSRKSTFHDMDVEHCAFNQAIRRNGGKVFINPALIIR